VSQPEPVVTIYVVNGVRTSLGPGPGVKRLPASEASALVSAKLAVWGDQPPRDVHPAPVTLTYPDVPVHKAAISN
jgi:hypothetical protein